MPESEDTPPSRRWCQRVLLVGWDGADWKIIEPLIEAGQMPNMARFIDEGVMGNVATLTPSLSPILWTSIATGKHADKHDILGFAEPDPSTSKPRPVTSTSRKCKAIWNIISDAGLKAGVLNWYASHPAEPVNGSVVSDRFPQAVGPPNKEWPNVTHSVHPAELLERACKLRIHPLMTAPPQIKEFLPKLGTWDVSKDKHVAKLRTLVAECATVHMAATWLMQEQEWDFCGIYYPTIDRLAHEFMEFYPPQMKHVSDEDFDRFKDVMPACYGFHDMMLGRLMELAGDDATIIIVSDHGFHCDERRPEGSSSVDEKPVAWHRPYGVLAIRGPQVKKDERVYGASLLDIAPTVLTLLGLPVADDMDGNALREILDVDQQAVVIDRIDTYETGTPKSVEPEAAEDPWVAEQMLRRLADLGYIDAEGRENTGKIVSDRVRNLAQVYASTRRPAKAVEQYRRVLETAPDDLGSKMGLAWALLSLQRFDECEQLMNEMIAGEHDAPRANLLKAILAFHRGHVEESLKHLKIVEQNDGDCPGLHRQLGMVYLRRNRLRDAEHAFNKALKGDPEDAESHDGLGAVYRRQGRPAEAVHEHMQSVALLHYHPETHLHLGMALAEAGQIDWAIRAFNVSLEMNPVDPRAHRCLADIYARAKGDQATAREHALKARKLRQVLRRNVAQRA